MSQKTAILKRAFCHNWLKTQTSINPIHFCLIIVKSLEVKLKEIKEKCSVLTMNYTYSLFPRTKCYFFNSFFFCFKVVRAFMLAVAVFVTAVTARPDSAGIVEMVNGFAYGKERLLIPIFSSIDVRLRCSQVKSVIESAQIIQFFFLERQSHLYLETKLLNCDQILPLLRRSKSK